MSSDARLPPSVLIANRGEIASRIIRTCRALDVRSDVVYSDADHNAPHVAADDDAVRIGPAPAERSYLNIDAIIDGAYSAGAQAVHPGYGFLSERADFARAVGDAGLIWVSPPPDVIADLGDKAAARRLAISCGVPVEADAGDAALAAAIMDLKLPVMIKAAAGGGGRGMRLLSSTADAPDGLEAAVASARREAQAAFGDGRLLVERAHSDGRHVEVQVLFDAYGNGVHLGERDCSVQRRRQKVIEESPSPAIDESLRHELGEAALRVCAAAGYVGAGTVEFLLLPDTFPDYSWLFLEVNTRIQVEHPVTGAVARLDLVEWQLRIAGGEPLSIEQDAVTLNGHAIELRIYAEDPSRGYMPSTGRLRWFEPLDTRARHDIGPVTDDDITAHYDPMLAKKIVHAPTRAQALARASEALDGWAIDGVTTNTAQLAAILAAEDFRWARSMSDGSTEPTSPASATANHRSMRSPLPPLRNLNRAPGDPRANWCATTPCMDVCMQFAPRAASIGGPSPLTALNPAPSRSGGNGRLRHPRAAWSSPMASDAGRCYANDGDALAPGNSTRPAPTSFARPRPAR